MSDFNQPTQPLPAWQAPAGSPVEPQTGIPYAPQPSKPKRSKKHLIGYPLTAIIALAIGSSGGSDATTSTTASPTATVTVAGPTETVEVAAPTVTVPGPAVTVTAAPPKPATTFGEGDYTVGVDIPAGRYTTIEAVSSGCYWGIYKTGTNHEDIISNDIVNGGFPKVTLKKGQDFSSSDCGDWKKVG